MSKKSLVLLVVAALTMSLAFAVSMSFAEVDKGPAEITLNADSKSEKPKPALFPHAKHQEKNGDCGSCHHYVDKDGIRNPCDDGSPKEYFNKCDSCHNADFANEKLRTWKDIGHGLCKACHTKMKADGAPTKCSACHPTKK
ncbi:MAG: cytochrome c family protein [Desulfobacterales bacterium]